jgi:ABC-type transport system involved in cytochrome bd biosynthesis fused ATPase/permease subunit
MHTWDVPFLKIVLMVTLREIMQLRGLGMLRNKTRVLVTHQLQFVSNTDLIAVLKDGKVMFPSTNSH